jgi:hypothetical protein
MLIVIEFDSHAVDRRHVHSHHIIRPEAAGRGICARAEKGQSREDINQIGPVGLLPASNHCETMSIDFRCDWFRSSWGRVPNRGLLVRENIMARAALSTKA